MIYDSAVGFLELKALSLKDKLENYQIDKLIDYMKQLLNKPVGRNTFNSDKYQFYFNKHLTLKGIKIQNDVLTEEKVATN